MGISIWQLLIILAIVLVLFGAKRLRNLGSDLGASVRGFRDAVKEGEAETEAEAEARKGDDGVGGHLGNNEEADDAEFTDNKDNKENKDTAESESRS